MSQPMWNYYQNINQYSVPIQENYVSDSSNYTQYDPRIFYNQDPSLTYAATHWPNYPVPQNTSCQQFYYQSRPETHHGWHQHAEAEQWNSCHTTECNQIKRQKTQLESAVQTTEVATSTSHGLPTKPRPRARAHISFVNSANGDFTPVIKRKRTRTAFTTSQIKILEKQFRKRPYVSPEERRVLTEQLQVSDKVVKVWFQNRRLKDKRENEESCSSLSPDSATSHLPDTNIDIANNTVNELLNAIEQVISDDLKSGEVVNDVTNTVIYEPVSPPAFSQKLDTTFVPVDPLTALQNVIESSEA